MSLLLTCANCIWEEFNIIGRDCKQENETTLSSLPVYQHHRRPHCQSKIIWNQVCVVDGFSSAKLYQQRSIAPVIKTISDNFPEKSELPKFILLVKIRWFNFFCGVRGRNEKFTEIREGSLSRLTASPLEFTLASTQCSLVFQR